MQQTYEFFRKEFEFHGKHARMADELCSIKDIENNYFKRVIDIYLLAAIVGFRFDRRAKVDYSSADTKSIFPEVMNKEKENLDFIMQIILMLDNVKSMNSKESVIQAFKGALTKEQYIEYETKFNDYVRGGLEEIYESLIVRKPEIDEGYADEKTANMMMLLKRL